MSDGVQRSFLAGRSMGEAVYAERKATRVLLASHGLYMAMRALDVAAERSFLEFIAIRKRVLERGEVVDPSIAT